MSSLSSVAGKGALWQVFTSGLQAIVRVSASAILARRLDPVDFGIFGIAYMCYELFNRLSISGLTSGLIAKKNLTREDLSTCFWAVITSRGVLFFLMLLFAPAIASFFKNPKLVPVLRVISFVFIITGCGAVSQTILTRKLFFKKLALIRLTAGILESIIAVILVLTTNIKYWSLVLAILLSSIFFNLLVIIKAKWFPTFTFNFKRFKYFFNFGINSMGTAILSYFSTNLDYWVVAKLLGARMLGFYEFAYRIPHMISERVSSPAGSVFFPVLAAGERTNEQLARGYLKASSYLAWIMFPCFGGLAITAPLVVNVLWGKKWLLIVPSLQILCIAAALGSFWWLHRGVFLVKNRPDLPLKLSILQFIFACLFIVPLCYKFGIIGVACGITLSRFVQIISSWLAMKMLSRNFKEWLFVVAKPLLVTLFMMIIVYLVRNFLLGQDVSSVSSLIICILIGALAYILLAFILFKREVLEFKSIVV